jgi:hypothetical protein
MSAITHCGWQTGLVAILPAVETHARIQLRKLPIERREDVVQEAIASAVIAYRRLAEQGRLDVAHPSTIAAHAVHHVRNGRHVGGSQDSAKDVLSPVCQERHGVTVLRLDAAGSPTRTGEGWKQVAVESRNMSIPDLAAFRIDFGQWLRSLSRRDRKIIRAMVSGEGTNAVAGRFGISQGRVSQLRRKFQREWQAFQGETVDSAA